MTPIECNVCGKVRESKILRTVDFVDRFEIAAGISKRDAVRFWALCGSCGCAVHVMPKAHQDALASLETSYYAVDLGNQAQLAKKYRYIMSLPSSESDNAQRVARVLEYVKSQGTGKESTHLRLCDIGSGLGIFLARVNEVCSDYGIKSLEAIGVEPDATAHQFSLEQNAFESRRGYFPEAIGSARFDLITLNKVLEHVDRPMKLLQSCLSHVVPEGLVYVEVPCVSNAIEKRVDDNALGSLHRNLYSSESLARLMARVGFSSIVSRRIEEPSGKLTVYAFARRPNP